MAKNELHSDMACKMIVYKEKLQELQGEIRFEKMLISDMINGIYPLGTLKMEKTRLWFLRKTVKDLSNTVKDLRSNIKEHQRIWANTNNK